MSQVGGVIQHEPALMQGPLHDVILSCVKVLHGLLQVTHTAVHQLGRTAGGRGGVVSRFNYNGLQAAQLSVHGAACSRGPSADHTHIERSTFDLLQDF